jgi:repressor LexA
MKQKPILTQRQQEIYDFLKDKILNRGYGPTVREIGTEFGIHSPNGVMCHLKALERKGLISREPHMSRAIQLSDQPISRSSLPNVGKLTSAAPLDVLDHGDQIDFASLFENENNFAVTASGETLADLYIADGDTIVIRPGKSASDGDIVLAAIEGQDPVLRVYTKDGAKVKLEASRKIKAIVSTAVTILGKAVAVIRKY